jgi:hypothetical protein
MQRRLEPFASGLAGGKPAEPVRLLAVRSAQRSRSQTIEEEPGYEPAG